MHTGSYSTEPAQSLSGSRDAYFEVAVDLPYTVYEPFTYSGGGLPIQIGDLVRVPFKEAERYGVVVKFSEILPKSVPAASLRSVISRIEGGPFVSDVHVELALWISKRYSCGLFVALSPMLPPGLVSRVKIWLTPQVGESSRKYEQLPPLARRALQIAHEENKVVLSSTLAKKLGRWGEKSVASLRRAGLFSASYELPQPKRKVTVMNVLALSRPFDHALEILAASPARIKKEKRRALLQYLQEKPNQFTASNLSKIFGVAAVNWARSEGLIATTVVEKERDPVGIYEMQTEFPPKPYPEQAIAIAAISSALGKGRGKFLLFGVTGSGKTEVYLRAIERCLALGKRAIVLVPEIAMTEQMFRRVISRFPGKVGLSHSGLTPSERYGEWMRIRRGQRDIILGSRSAIFAPVKNLGLVVVDEEHEWAYEQNDKQPRYGAREVAEKLAELSNVVVILGSATPDVGTYRKTESGGLTLLRLPKRIAATPFQRATIVNMLDELRAGNISPISRPLMRMMEESLEANGRVMLFLNLRGYAPLVQCIECGEMRRCPKCAVTLVYHLTGSSSDRLLCHHCGYSISYKRPCPVCGGREVRRRGQGIQALEEFVRKIFPKEEVIRWDADTARTAKAHSKIWESVERGKARILIGTQIIAKGHHFPSVTLAAAVAADIGLSVPDFRSAERTYQLLAQLIGRSGRGAQKGSAVIQTYSPTHYAITSAASQDYETFYNYELSVRARHNLPPFTRLLRLRYLHSDPISAKEEARDYAKLLREWRLESGNTQVNIEGPSPTWPPRFRGMYGWQIILKSSEPEQLLKAAPVRKNWTVEGLPI